MYLSGNEYFSKNNSTHNNILQVNLGGCAQIYKCVLIFLMLFISVIVNPWSSRIFKDFLMLRYKTNLQL